MMKDRYEVTVAVPAEAVKPLLKLDKNTIKYTVTCATINFQDFQSLTVPKVDIFLRLFFLKRFGYPLGCAAIRIINMSTRDGKRQSFCFKGKKFMDKIIEPTKDGWQMELRYRE